MQKEGGEFGRQTVETVSLHPAVMSLSHRIPAPEITSITDEISSCLGKRFML